jgi:hypothetical protein
MNGARKAFLILGGAALIFTLGVVSTYAYVRHQGFITVRVQENWGHGDDVAMRIPACLVSCSLPFVPRERLCGRSGVLDEHKQLLRGLVKELKEMPDCELVTVDSPEEQVRIRKVGRDLVIDVHDHGDKVFVSVPVHVMDKVATWM